MADRVETLSTALAATYAAVRAADGAAANRGLERVATETTVLCLRCSLLEHLIGEILGHPSVLVAALDCASDELTTLRAVLDEARHAQ